MLRPAILPTHIWISRIVASSKEFARHPTLGDGKPAFGLVSGGDQYGINGLPVQIQRSSCHAHKALYAYLSLGTAFLITGSSGFLGEVIAKGLHRRYQIIGLDVRKPKQPIDGMETVEICWAINAARQSSS